VTAVIWGTVSIGGKIAMRGISAPYLSSIRLLFAALFLAVVLALRGRFPRRGPPRLAIWAGLGLAGNYVLYMWGLDRSGTATAQVLIQTAPLFLILLSVFALGERPGPAQIVGIMLAAVGVWSVTWSGEALETTTAGALLLLAAAATWAVYGACHKRLGDTEGSTTTMMWIFLIAGLTTLPTALLDARFEPNGPQTAAIAYLCVNTIVAYWAFAEALRHIPASLASVIATLGPVVTFGLVALAARLEVEGFPHEEITTSKMLGAAAVITGVILAVARRARPAPAPTA
jgi:drug/metabolite transporter (DMT)-like permease